MLGNFQMLLSKVSSAVAEGVEFSMERKQVELSPVITQPSYKRLYVFLF